MFGAVVGVGPGRFSTGDTAAVPFPSKALALLGADVKAGEFISDHLVSVPFSMGTVLLPLSNSHILQHL